MSEPKADAKAIFLKALECEGAEALTSFLDQACGADAALRRRVEELLQAHRDAGGFLGGAEKLEATRDDPVAERPGVLIGPYKLLQQIGEGGMGIVFMAEQTQPVQRKVALKVIKAGMNSRQVVARFEAERQALALMDHVNIARVFDGGATEHGRPYFVMELVHGVPITKYCDDNHLTPRERLELFVPVCQAIQHAHQKGIIHRDIKPSNVMVTLYDGKPVPKVIDFGVAKATEQKLTERTLFTQYGTMVGTLEYRSPEQAEMSALGVDTRSDLYSLGVLLYELLTGTTPLDRQRMKEAAFAEILRTIKEEEPPRPSNRLSDSGEALASISAQRHTEPAKLTRLLRGELDWIVMKALDKDRNRRYETASALAADVHRYLHDEPVQACPPSTWYRFRKFARRNKAVLLTASVVVLAVSLTGAVSTALIWRANQNLQQTLERERRDSYFHRITLAHRELSADNLGGALKLLDDWPAITIKDVAVTEGNSGTRNAVFTVGLSAASTQTVTVAFATANGSAIAGSDYQASFGTVTFAPGETSKTVTVQIVGDRLPELIETFVVNLSNPTNATIADGQGVGTILDDEPRISISDVTKSEGKKGRKTLFTFTVTLSAAYDQPVTMSFQTVNGTAITSDNDYIAKTGTLTFAPGETTKTITIEVKGDSKREANETFYVDLFDLSSNALFTRNRGIGTILNDD